MGKVIQFKCKDIKRTWKTELSNKKRTWKTDLVNKMQDKIIDEARNNWKRYFELFVDDEYIMEGVEMCLMISHVINYVLKDKNIKISISYYDKDKLEHVRYNIESYIEAHQDVNYCSIIDVDIMK